MSTASPDLSPAGRRGVRTAAVATLLAVALALSACTSDPRTSSSATPAPTASSTAPGAADGTSTTPSITGLPVPRDLGRAFGRLLDDRSRALEDGDRDLFLAGLDRRDAGFVTAQDGYFDNLAQLPVRQVGLELEKASLVRARGSYWVVVRVTLQLDGFDALPAVSLHRYRFTSVKGGRYRLSSVYDRAWETANDVQRQPWETTEIRVEAAPGVLGVFDAGTAAAARPLMRSVVAGISDVAARVPYDWDRTVVFYALSDLRFVAGLDNLPGDDPDALDGIAFTVPAGPGDPRAASTRVAFNPRVLAADRAELDRLVRHELTHVATAAHDDFAPTWLTEGLAEWVSVQALAPQDREVSDEALAAAEAGIRRMPATSTFNDTDSDVHYAVSWWSCEYLAATYGPTAPWLVLDAFAGPDLDERKTIDTMLSLSVDALARRGAKLLVSTYDPAFYGTGADETPSTSTTPTDGASPPG